METVEYVDADVEEIRDDVEQDRQVGQRNEDSKLAEYFELQSAKVGVMYKREDWRDIPRHTIAERYRSGVGVLQRRPTAEGEMIAEGERGLRSCTTSISRIKVSGRTGFERFLKGRDAPNCILCWKPPEFSRRNLQGYGSRR